MSSPRIQHIVFSVSAASLLRTALRSAGRHDRVLAFPDNLAYGPIDPPSPALRLRWLTSELGYLREDWDWLPRSVQAFWRGAREPAARRVVWTSSRAANEHAAFLAWLERMAGEEFEVIDMGDMEVIFKADDGRSWRDKAVSLGMVGSAAIAEQTLWDRATSLADAEREMHLAAWKRLREENAAFRLIGPEGLVSQPISVFDDALLAEAPRDWQRAVRTIGAVMAEDVFSYYHQVGDHPLASRLVRLIAAGKVELRVPSDGGRHGAYEFEHGRLPFHTEIRLPR